MRDTGRIDPAFRPPLRAVSARRRGEKRHGGLGLGLSIVRHIVEMHDGTVEARSDGRDLGSTFVVRLPAIDTSADKVAPVGRERQEAMAAAPRLDGLRVLVVDDEADARSLIAAVLQGRGAAVFMAASATEALAMLQAEHPDVVLSDISMRDEDGYDLIRNVRALAPESGGRTPAAALTAYGRLEDRMRPSQRLQCTWASPGPGELVAVVATRGAHRPAGLMAIRSRRGA